MQSLCPLPAEILCLTDETIDLHADKLSRTQSMLTELFARYLAEQSTDIDHIRINDCFYFIFTPCPFDAWREADWWDQREILKEIRTNPIYRQRTTALLNHSIYREHFRHRVDRVPDQDDPMEQYASRRERLYLKEGFENSIDAISHAAYYGQKYSDCYPGLLQLIYTQKQNERIVIVDNGCGRRFRKPSRKFAFWRLLYKTYRLIMNHGAYYIGGMHMGLKVTYGRLHCYGEGAVVGQAPFADIYGGLHNK